MKLSELIAEIGDDNVQFNFSHNFLVGGSIKQKNGYVECKVGIAGISILDLVASEPDNLVMMVVLPGEKVREIHARLKAEKALEESK